MRQWQWLILAGVAWSSASGELPPESQLPPSVEVAVQSLPSESELPPNVQKTSPAGSPDTRQLPAESELRPLEGAAIPPAGPLPLAGSPDGIPWLRLNVGGHSAPVRAVEFLPGGDRLCTAGDDKDVHIWMLVDDQWRHERTIRWQVQRATRGRIYALAAVGDLLAIAGEGAMGGTGEILLVNPANGDLVATLVDAQQGHRQVVVDLDAVNTASGPVLVSQSMDGRTLLWTRDDRGVWRAKVVVPDDRSAGIAVGQGDALLRGRALSAIAALDATRVVVPVFDRAHEGRLVWRLDIFDTSGGIREPLGKLAAPHWFNTTALAANEKRTMLASADAAGTVYLWDLQSTPPRQLKLPRTEQSSVLSLAVSPDGNRLVVGTTQVATQAGVEVWNVSRTQQPKLLASLLSNQHVLACDVSPDQQTVAYADADQIHVQSLASKDTQQSLEGTAQMPLRVAFSREEPFYRLGIGIRREGNEVPIDQMFDTDRLQLSRTQANDADWLPRNWASEGWQVVESRQPDQTREWWLAKEGEKKSRLPLTEERTGAYRTVCWIAGQQNDSPALAAVGTSSGEIFVVQVVEQGDAPIKARFRGHGSEIASLAVSRDLRYLASAGRDATVRVWSLRPARATLPTQSRWGATFGTDEVGRVFVESIREDGPLFFRGARQGDVVVACTALVNQERDRRETGDAILDTLTKWPWDGVLEFELQTGRQPPRSFQILPAWQQLVSLVIDQHAEWAYWAPSGYYDASFAGHQLFGWQVNRGLESLPDFFLAAQFRATLERPDVMSRLLTTGTLEEAFRDAWATPPADPSQAIANAYRLKPRVAIVSPDVSQAWSGNDLPLVRAEIDVPAGQRLVLPKAFANGVVAPAGRLVDQSSTNDGFDRYVYEWAMAVPSDERLLVQVVAGTDNEATASDERTYQYQPLPRQRPPRLVMLGVAIDEYGDAQIPRLTKPVSQATELAELLQDRSTGLYDVQSTLLLGDRAVAPAWAWLADDITRQLRDGLSPDDVLLVYLSGHGMQDTTRDDYHFVAASARFQDLMAGRFGDCLSFDNLATFAELSCRKIVILDTCHANAIQPMRHRELKWAIRSLQQDQVITLAASDGAEEAVEGRFASKLLDGLRGAADREAGDSNGTTSLHELVAYIDVNVARDASRTSYAKHPWQGRANYCR